LGLSRRGNEKRNGDYSILGFHGYHVLIVKNSVYAYQSICGTKDLNKVSWISTNQKNRYPLTKTADEDTRHWLVTLLSLGESH
jgi:hypothetical protein